LKRILFLLVLIAWYSKSYAQQPYFKSLQVAKKIEEIRIQRLIQDQHGFIWLGTNRGLRRFNGTSLTQTNLPVTVDNDITALFVKDNTLLAGTKKGMLVVIDLLKPTIAESFITVDDEITSLTIDAKGKIWIATASSGILFGEKNNLDRIDNQIGLPDNIIHAIIATSNGICAATDVGLVQWDNCEAPSEFKLYTIENGLCDNLITSLALGKNNTVYIGAQNGAMCKWYSDNKSVAQFDEFNNILKGSIVKIIPTDNEVFCFTEDHFIFTGSAKDNQFVQSSLSENGPFNSRNPFMDGLYDQEGNLIVCNKSNSLLVSDSRFLYLRSHEELDLQNIRAITSDRNNNLWFSTPNGLFSHNYLFSNQQKLQKYLPAPKKSSEEIICLAEGNDSAIWFGMYGSGLGRIDLKTKKIKYFTEKDGLLNNNVLSITADGNKLWIATLGGVCVLEKISKEWIFWNLPQDSKLSTYVYSVFKDKQGRIWFGSDGDGPIYRNTSGQYIALKDQFPLVADNILSIKQDTDGNIWFLTSDQQLQCFKGDHIEKRDLISDGEKPNLLAIENDDKGNIFVFTSSGFAIVRGDTPSFEFVSSEETLSSNYLNVSTKDYEGNIWVGLEPSLIRFVQNDKNSRHQPLVRIEDILVQLQSIDTTLHEFSYEQNHFTFQVTGLWYKQPDKVRFRYKLIGYDSNWAITRDNQIVFSKLDPGDYTFVVQASANDDFNEANEMIYKFTIERPFWQKWWFISLILLIVFATVFIILRAREQQLQKNALLQRERLKGQFETLRNQINPHFLFNSFNTLISTIAKDKDQAIDYVEQLSDYFRIILEQREKEVITLKEELELADRYLFLQKQRFGDNLIVLRSIPEELLESLIPPMTIQLLVENAIKHNIISRLKPLTIELNVSDNYLIVSNTLQEKTQKEPSTGVGLNNIVHRYLILFKKEVQVVKNENRFEVLLPLNQPSD
jgi:ligand-binding sensor domain-containing protein/uncharacterized membrane-anchored protein YhcB (DUF1043 family)